jgi:hypothetical protein
MRSSIELQLDRLARDRWARRGVRTLLRAAWIGLSIWCIGLGARLLFSWDLPLEWIGIASLGCLAVGAALILRPRMRPQEVARRLDRRFGLHEQLSTALELGADEQRGVPAYLSEQSRRTIVQVRRFVNSKQRLPWPELITLLALALVIFGMLVLLGIGPLNLGRGALPLPPLVGPLDSRPPDEPFNPPAGQQPGPGPGETLVPGPGDQQVISALAEALRDQSVTRPAAEALDSGDLAGAAQQLRELADQAEQLSPAARQDLAEALREAASQIAQDNPEAAQQLSESADGIEQGGAPAAEALEQLAEAVEQLGQQAGQPGEQQGQGQGQGQSEGGQEGQGSGGAGQGLAGEQREQRADRLNIDGVPLELESDGPGDTPTEGDAEGGNAASGNGGFVQGSSNPDSGLVQAGDDPLSIPADLRDVVQDYFTP